MTAIANTVVRPDRVLPGPLRHEANHRGPGAGQRRAPHEQHVAGNRADGPGGRDPDDPHPMRLQRRGGRKLIITPEGGTAPARKPSRDETLVKALVRAHRWRRRIESGQT